MVSVQWVWAHMARDRTSSLSPARHSGGCDPDSDHIAEQIADALRTTNSTAEEERLEAKQRLEKQHRAVLSRIDRGYDDYVSGKITEEFWTRKSEQWEGRTAVAGDRPRAFNRPNGHMAVTGQKILELAKKAGF